LLSPRNKQDCYPPSRKERKAQIDVDFIISYVIFIFFIIFLVNFILNLISPFRDASNFQIQERRSFLMQNILNKEKIPFQNFDILCNTSLNYISRLKVHYLILGFKMPSYDLAATDYDVLFTREEDIVRLRARADSKTTYYIADVSITRLSLESDDVITNSTDINSNIKFTICMNINSTDTDELIIDPGLEDVFIKISFENVNISRAYIGEIPFYKSCGKQGYSTRHFHVENYAIMSYDNKFFPIKIGINGWWL